MRRTSGQSVDFTITVNGATDASVPQNIDVDGLTITYEGPNSQTQISFGTGFGSGSHIQRSVIHTYSVVAQRAGDFVIPAQQVMVDGKTYTTQPVNLKVGGTASRRRGSGRRQEAAERRQDERRWEPEAFLRGVRAAARIRRISGRRCRSR